MNYQLRLRLETQQLRAYRLEQQLNFELKFRTLHPGDRLWVRDQATVSLEKPNNIALVVITNKGTLRCNRSALVVTTKHPVMEHSGDDVPSETTTALSPTLPSKITRSQQLPQTSQKRKVGAAMLTSPGTVPAAGSLHGHVVLSKLNYSFRNSYEATKAL